jgi:pimeloyl-ACP methyl ester carboxylesterase
LNEYLDELIRILPVDADKVYASGHSLGAMATFNWATSNPERFAAIYPEDGFGQPYRAVRLRYVPLWSIHGERDDVILPGLAEQMVSVRAAGGSAVYSRLKGAPHNIPSWFNSEPVTNWCLQHVRSHHAPSADPRNSLGLQRDGFSDFSIVSVPADMFWSTEAQTLDRISSRAGGDVIAKLFAKAEVEGAIVDCPVRYVVDSTGKRLTPWLAVPLALQPSSNNDTSIIKLPARKAVHFYFTGAPDRAAVHLKEIQTRLPADQRLSDKFWITPLGPDHDNSRTQVYECQCDLRTQ